MQTTVDTDERGLTRLLVAGEIDMQVAPRLTEAIGDLLRDGHDRVVVDLSAVTFLDSSGLASLVDGYHQAEQDRPPTGSVAPTASCCGCSTCPASRNFY